MAQTKRQLLEQQLAQSQQLLQNAQNPDLFGSGRAGAFGAIAQGITAGIGAYSAYKTQQKILANEAKNVEIFKQFAISKGNQPLADVAESLSPETREAYVLQSTSPRYTSFNQFTPAKIQEFEYYQNLPSDELRKQFLNVQRDTTGKGAFLTQSGKINVVPGYGEADAQKKALETQAQKEVQLDLDPKIAGETTFAKEKAQEDVKAQEQSLKINAQVGNLFNVLNQFENHPGLSDLVGAKGGGAILSYAGKETPIAGTNAAGAKALLDQIKGQQFLQAFESLKGGGQISEKEGEAATKALSAINERTSEKDLKQNINTLRDILQRAQQRASTRAQQGYQRVSVQSPMQQGLIEKTTIIKRYNPQTGRIE